MQSPSIEALVLLAVVIAACDTDDVDHPVRRVLDKKLGAGWAHEIAMARAHDERLDVLQRRLAFTSESRFSAARATYRAAVK